MDYTLRFRAYLDEETASEAWRHIDIHRQIRNHAVREYYHSPRDDRPSEFDQINKLPAWKRQWRPLRTCRRTLLSRRSVRFTRI
jgi:putative transposase